MKYLKIFKLKISYFDVGLGIVFLGILIGLIIFFGRKNEYINIKVKVTDQDVLYANTNPQNWYANRFIVGDTEKDNLGRVTGTITGVQTFNTTATQKAVYLDLKIRAVYDKRTDTYAAKGTTLAFGSSLRFYFSKVVFNAILVGGPGSTLDMPTNNTEITLLARGVNKNSNTTGVNEFVEPEIYEKIKVGDKISDSNGRVLLKVDNIRLRPAQEVTQDIYGNLHLKYDPYYKDAVITASIFARSFDGELYVMDNTPLKLGQSIPLNFDYESIFPTLINISN